MATVDEKILQRVRELSPKVDVTALVGRRTSLRSQGVADFVATFLG